MNRPVASTAIVALGHLTMFESLMHREVALRRERRWASLAPELAFDVFHGIDLSTCVQRPAALLPRLEHLLPRLLGPRGADRGLDVPSPPPEAGARPASRATGSTARGPSPCVW